MQRLIWVLCIWIGGCYNPPEANLVDEVPIVGVDGGSAACGDHREGQVVCVIDGDTLDIGQCGDGGERVRLLGIDAPEVAGSGHPAECWSEEATVELSRLLLGRTVTLTFDQNCFDIYDRTLAYIWLLDEESGEEDTDTEESSEALLVNEWLLEKGFVFRYDEDWVDTLYLEDRFIEAEQTACELGLGLWNYCDVECEISDAL